MAGPFNQRSVLIDPARRIVKEVRAGRITYTRSGVTVAVPAAAEDAIAQDAHDLDAMWRRILWASRRVPPA